MTDKKLPSDECKDEISGRRHRKAEMITGGAGTDYLSLILGEENNKKKIIEIKLVFPISINESAQCVSRKSYN